MKLIQKNIPKLYFFEFFSEMFFAVPVIVLFWQAHGLSLAEVMILQSLFAIAIVLLEIPTGYMADIFGRKKMLLFAGISLLLGMVVYSVSFDFLTFLFAEFFFALGISLYSGAGSALAYDTLSQVRKEKLYNKVWGNAKFYGLMGIAVSNVVGGFIGKYDLRWTFIMSIPFMIILIPLALSLKEPKRHKLIVKKGYLKSLSAIIKELFRKNLKLRLIILYSSVLFALNAAGLWLYQPYFTITGVDIVYFGVIFASFQVVAAVSSKWAHKFEDWLGRKLSLIVLVGLVVVGYFLTSKIIFIFSFVFIYFFQFVRGISEPIISHFINELTTSDIRATILSINNLGQRLLYALFIPFVGWIADIYSITQAFLVSAVTALIGGSIVLIILTRHKVV